MKMIKSLTGVAFTLLVLGGPFAGLATDQTNKLIPDTLITCPVSGEKLGEMGKPFVFEYKGQQVKLCCKNCKKDFDKDPAKYMKKIREADKAAPAKKDANK